MANEFYTLIVVPHAKARFRKIQIPVRLAKWVMGSVAAVALVICGVLFHYTRLAGEVYEARNLRSENQVLLNKTQEYELNAGRLQAQVKSLQNVVSKLGIMAGGQSAEMVFSKWTINGVIPATAFTLPPEVASLVPKVTAK